MGGINQRLNQRQWHELPERVQWMLCRVNDCGLIAADDLHDLIWDGQVKKQNTWHSMKRWVSQRLLNEMVHLVGTDRVKCYALGVEGRRLLVLGGIAVPERRKAEIAPRMRESMIIASNVLVQLWRDLGTVGGVAGATWKQDPFRGAGVRADASMIVSYAAAGPGAGDDTPPVPTIQPELRTSSWAPTPESMRHWLIVEIDAGSETREELIARAQNWQAAWPTYVQQIPAGTVPRFVWVTTGTWRRAKTIWEIWNDYAWLPLLISTRRSLHNPGDGRVHPGHPLRRAADGSIHAVWRDELGRVRSLIPGMLHEDRWLEGASIVSRRSEGFRAACAEQDTQEPPAQWCDDDLIRLGSGPRTRRLGGGAIREPADCTGSRIDWRQVWQ